MDDAASGGGVRANKRACVSAVRLVCRPATQAPAADDERGGGIVRAAKVARVVAQPVGRGHVRARDVSARRWWFLGVNFGNHVCRAAPGFWV
jgi:hypothetical protein